MCLDTCSLSAIYRKRFSRLSTFRNQELNLIHLNDLKVIVQRSCTENTNFPIGLQVQHFGVHWEQFIRNSNCLKLSLTCLDSYEIYGIVKTIVLSSF